MSDVHAGQPAMRKVYSLIKVSDGGSFRGYLHVPMDQRVQDLLNDSRQFIPLHLGEDTDEVAIIAKRYIVSLEEIRDRGAQPFTFR